MFERFTDEARNIVVLAQEESRLRGHDYIGCEHLLCALVSRGDGPVAAAFTSVQLDREKFATAVEEIVGRSDQDPAGHIPFTPEAKRSMELALREALQAGDDSIRPQHLLLGLLAANDKTVRRLLRAVTVDVDRLRAVVLAAAAAEPVERRWNVSGGRARAVTLRTMNDHLARIDKKLDTLTELVRSLQQRLDGH